MNGTPMNLDVLRPPEHLASKCLSCNKNKVWKDSGADRCVGCCQDAAIIRLSASLKFYGFDQDQIASLSDEARIIQKEHSIKLDQWVTELYE